MDVGTGKIEKRERKRLMEIINRLTENGNESLTRESRDEKITKEEQTGARGGDEDPRENRLENKNGLQTKLRKSW